MKALQDLDIFVRTAELGSLSAAARRLDLTPAAASAALKRLEATLQVALFVRSTRSQRLTAEGEVFLLHCRQALDLLASGREAVASGRSVVRGVLQLSLPSDLGRHVLLPWLDEFQATHPQVELRLQLSDRLADVYRQPVDLAIRYGTLPDSSLVALPLLPGNRRVLCASPDYLARAGAPASPAELTEHNCLCFQLGDTVHDRWCFSRDGRATSHRVHGDRVSDDGEVVRRWALAGHGLAYKSHADVHADLRAGRLVAVCPQWQGEPTPLNLLCADRRQLSPAVQQLRAFLMPRLAALAP
ncbi:LysR family transcriptional regulator [Zoogloeaceae bacterium G21618-S1]|nr:LysR family transcriptional regulator [Zoogloeaceae bacterium G21618-S1]